MNQVAANSNVRIYRVCVTTNYAAGAVPTQLILNTAACFVHSVQKPIYPLSILPHTNLAGAQARDPAIPGAQLSFGDLVAVIQGLRAT